MLRGAKSSTSVSVFDCACEAGRECYDINLLGTGTALCWHVPPFHADNVKYLSTGVCGHPERHRIIDS